MFAQAWLAPNLFEPFQLQEVQAIVHLLRITKRAC